VDLSIPYPGPILDTGYFPDTISTWYWSSSPYAYNADDAWHVDFYYGVSNGSFSNRNDNYAVRLVRGGQ